MLPRNTNRRIPVRLLLVCGMLIVALGVGVSANGALAGLRSAADLSQPVSNVSGPADPFDCSQISRLGIDRQMNNHAAELLAGCGYNPKPVLANPSAPGDTSDLLQGAARLFSPLLGGTDSNTILPDGAYPKVTQSENMVWAHGSTIIVNYNDSRTSSGCYAGLSYSTNSGATWTSGQPFCSGHGTNFGDPIVVWNNLFNKWVAGDLATGCGGQGLGIWTSTNNGVSWSVGPCAHNSSQDDRESFYVDNNPSSPNYGTMFMSFANYNLPGPPISVIRSTDGGTTWSAPVNLALPAGASFVRNVQDTGGTNGTFYIAAMNEGGGGLSPRTNYMYRSTDGGLTWSAPIAMGSAFAAPGVATSGYFALFFPTIWRYMGWGQPAGGPNGVVHYAYTQHGAGADPGDIYYVRSTDSGLTWSAPLKMNQDVTTNGNWQPSVAVTTQGGVLVSWYDGREAASSSCGSPGTSTACYRRWGRVSLDNGATWQADGAIGDAISGLPAQPDSGVQAVYEGDYDYSSADGTTAYTCWTDGRTLISATSQQDVYCDAIPLIIGTPTPTVTGTPPTLTRTPTSTFTPTSTSTPCGNTANYSVATGTATIVPGTTDTGNHTDDGSTVITLPFTYNLYGQPFTNASVTSNGQLDFQTANAGFTNTCLPDTIASFAIFPHWDDMNTTVGLSGCASYTIGCGIFTSVSGSAPNRIFNIEWRAVEYSNNANLVNAEVRLYEGQSRFDIVYGTVTSGGLSATIGVQRDTGSQFTQFSCNTASITSGLLLTFTQPPCATAVPTNTPTRTVTVTLTNTPTRTVTVTLTNTPTQTRTSTPAVTNTPTRTITPTATRTFTPAAVTVVGHVVWEGLPAQPNQLQQMPVTMTLKSGATEVNFARQLTDSSGFFTVTTALPNGTYDWRVKGNTYLARAGTVALTAGSVIQVEMGVQKSSDLNGDNTITVVDFNLVKVNFGTGGAPPLNPLPLMVLKR